MKTSTIIYRVVLLILAIALIWFAPETQMGIIKLQKLIGISEFFGRPLSSLVIQQVFGIGFGIATLIAQISFWVKTAWKSLFSKR